MPPRPRDLTGRRFGTLVVLGYEHHELWRCRCDCGRIRHVRSDSLTSGATRSCGHRAQHTDPTSYGGMHDRLRDQRGPARDYRCARCGARAAHWSYRGRDAFVRLESAAGPWSTRLDDYEPLCVPCHKRGDLRALEQRRARAHGAQPLWDE